MPAPEPEEPPGIRVPGALLGLSALPTIAAGEQRLQRRDWLRLGGVDLSMDLDALLDVPGDRIPLLTAGEAHVVLRRELHRTS
jgi:hypothetical protein